MTARGPGLCSVAGGPNEGYAQRSPTATCTTAPEHARVVLQFPVSTTHEQCLPCAPNNYAWRLRNTRSISLPGRWASSSASQGSRRNRRPDSRPNRRPNSRWNNGPGSRQSPKGQTASQRAEQQPTKPLPGHLAVHSCIGLGKKCPQRKDKQTPCLGKGYAVMTKAPGSVSVKSAPCPRTMFRAYKVCTVPTNVHCVPQLHSVCRSCTVSTDSAQRLRSALLCVGHRCTPWPLL